MESFNPQAMLSALLDAVDSEKIGRNYLHTKNPSEKLHLLAEHFRRRPVCPVERFRGGFPVNENEAYRCADGSITSIGIAHDFPDGHINFLFNPTKLHGTLNHEWLWQLNRHGFWWNLAGAYAQNHDETLAAAFDTQLRDWLSQALCPEDYQGPDSTWRTIECGIRLMNPWQAAFEVFRHSPSLTDEHLLLMVESMRRQAIFLSEHYTQRNFLIMEATGVYTFAALFPEIAGHEQLRQGALEKLTEELESQFLPDGFHNELSPDYFLVVYTCHDSLAGIARDCGILSELPPRIFAILEKAAETAVCLSSPGFTLPRTNDCYTILTSYITEKAAGLFPENPVFAFVNTQRQSGNPPEGKTASVYLPYAGFAIMRSDWGADAAYLCMDVGPLGMAHWHMDMLNINLFKGKDELLFDDGGGQYEKSPMRDYGRSSLDHNLVTVDGLGQMRREPMMADEPIDCGWISCDAFDYVCAAYDDGYGPEEQRLATHTRQLRFVKPGFFVLRDDLASRDGNSHDYAARFQLNTVHASPVEAFPGAVWGHLGKTYDLLMIPLDDFAETEIASARKEPDYAGWYVGRNDETLHPATTVIRHARQKRDYSFRTLLFPVRPDDPLPKITKTGSDTFQIHFEGKDYSLDMAKLNQ